MQPLDVVKTNRIIGAEISRQAGESLPRELTAIFERGAFWNGMYRGLLPMFTQGMIFNAARNIEVANLAPFVLVGTTAVNWLDNLVTLKQIWKSDKPIAYSQLVKEKWGAQGTVKVFTMGLPAAMLRNSMYAVAFLPRWQGNDWIAADLLFTMGAILLSHPFEAARVLMVNGTN